MITKNLQGNLPSGIFNDAKVQTYIHDGHKGGWLFSNTRTPLLDKLLIEAAYGRDRDAGTILTPKELAMFIVSPGGRYTLESLTKASSEKETKEHLEKALREFKGVLVKILDFKRV